MSNRIKVFVESKPFHHVIVSVIVLAGVVAGLETSPAIMSQYGGLLHGLDRVILAIFIVEALLKMAAHGRQPWRYFADGWNVFDFLIIALAIFAAIKAINRLKAPPPPAAPAVAEEVLLLREIRDQLKTR